MMTIAADLRDQLEPVRDQGRRPTCLAFATSAVHRAAHSHPYELCPEWLYYHATRRDGLRPEQGSTIEATCEVVPSKGQPEEEFWPYRSDATPTPYRPPSGAPKVLCCDVGRRNGEALLWRSELDAGHAVAIALFISDVFYSPAGFSGQEAVMGDDTDPIEPSRAHAVVLVGHGELRGARYLLVRNSWGPGWGWAGHAWFPETYLVRRFAGAFVIHHGAVNDVQSDETRANPSIRVG